MILYNGSCAFYRTAYSKNILDLVFEFKHSLIATCVLLQIEGSTVRAARSARRLLGESHKDWHPMHHHSDEGLHGSHHKKGLSSKERKVYLCSLDGNS